jgi:hypothetical protein
MIAIIIERDPASEHHKPNSTVTNGPGTYDLVEHEFS